MEYKQNISKIDIVLICMDNPLVRIIFPSIAIFQVPVSVHAIKIHLQEKMALFFYCLTAKVLDALCLGLTF